MQLQGQGRCSLQQWQSRLSCYVYETVGQLRIKEMFDIVADYQSSRPAVQDVRALIVCNVHLACNSRIKADAAYSSGKAGLATMFMRLWDSCVSRRCLTSWLTTQKAALQCKMCTFIVHNAHLPCNCRVKAGAACSSGKAGLANMFMRQPGSCGSKRCLILWLTINQAALQCRT